MENTIENLIKHGIKELEEAKIDNVILKAKILLGFLINKPKEYLTIYKDEKLDFKIIEQYKKDIEKIKQGVPLQYITHTQEFMGLLFNVDENVLIPRADTEMLVEQVLEIAKEKENVTILDLCTGSGAIAISLSKKLPRSNIYATDISKKSLEVAKKNNQQQMTNVEFILSDMFDNICKKDFDIIVCNPPYIETKTIQTLNKDVQQEPILALDGGEDGLAFYRRLANDAYYYLKPNGILAMEIGYNQKKSVIEILNKTRKL